MLDDVLGRTAAGVALPEGRSGERVTDRGVRLRALGGATWGF